MPEPTSQYYTNAGTGQYIDANQMFGAGNWTAQDLSNQGWSPTTYEAWNTHHTANPPPSGNPSGTSSGNSPTNTPPVNNPPVNGQPSGQPSGQQNQTLDDLFLSFLNQGYDNPEEIATASGKSITEVNSFLNSNFQAKNILNQNSLMNQLDAGYKDYLAKINQLNNGVFNLTPEEQAQIDRIQQLFNDMREKQIIANKNYEGAITTNNIRTGVQEFMNEEASGLYKQAVDQGVQKVKDLELEALSKVSELRQLFKDKRYKAIADSYNDLNKFINQKRQAINDIYKATADYYNSIAKSAAEAEEAETKRLQNEKLRQEIGQNTIEGLSPMLKDADEETLKQIADYYKLDINMLKGSQETSRLKAKEETDKFDQQMIGKGYRTINPADVSRLRNEGWDVVEYKGRAYASQPKLVSKTYKGVVTWYNEKTGKQVGSPSSSAVRSSGSGSSGVSSSSSNSYISPTKYKKDYDEAANMVEPILKSLMGLEDFKVSPDTYNGLKEQWAAQNLDPAQFDSRFKKYKDPYNPYYN